MLSSLMLLAPGGSTKQLTGMTYEREAIVEWLSSNDIDPSTGVELGQRKQLAPNVALRKLIAAWQEGHITSCK